MPPKRKAVSADDDDGDEATATAGLRRSTRRKSSAPAAAVATKSDDGKSLPAAATNKKSTAAAAAAAAAVKKKPRKIEPPAVKHDGVDKKTTGPASKPTQKTADGPAPAPSMKQPQKGKGAVKRDVDDDDAPEPTTAAATDPDAPAEKSYWLLKAEPETRLESGVDVKFSIDDLASRTEPEPWDGIRNYVARNNLRAMRKGDLAFFYHSNCKEPGIVGTMEIVREHSPDLSAHDSKAPYYDPKSKPEDPKWSVVHVEFRSKFAQQIGLKELREMGKPGQPLENMQLLKQSRLSVSRVSAAEWAYLMSVAEERGGASKTT